MGELETRPGQTTSDPKQILAVVVGLYQDLYAEKLIDDPACKKLLKIARNALTRVRIHEAQELIAPISIDEV